ncbi:MAG: type II toxin-antitoxin system RelE/ParE family toxin [bacterium]|nr:type II toxin-antitoxin system RelE/ParE family toxin [bacterium]
MWQVRVIGNARKQIKKLLKPYQKRILDSLDDLRQNPFAEDITKLDSKENTWRLRVGSYRVIFELFSKEKVVFVYEIKRRTSTTY